LFSGFRFSFRLPPAQTDVTRKGQSAEANPATDLSAGVESLAFDKNSARAYRPRNQDFYTKDELIVKVGTAPKNKDEI
jgi:hypothetical protein